MVVLLIPRPVGDAEGREQQESQQHDQHQTAAEAGTALRAWVELSVHPQIGELQPGLVLLLEPYASEKADAIRVPPSWAAYLEDRGGVLGSTGFPVGPALPAASSSYGTAGSYQRFEGLADYPRDAVKRWAWADRVPSAGAAIYYSEQHGPRVVEGAIGALYEELDGTYGWLGFPTSDESILISDEGGISGTGQQFEGGLVVCIPEHDPVPVRREVVDYLAGWPASEDQLGLPVQPPEPLAAGDGSYIQGFEHGIVVVRDGAVRAYLDRAG